MTDKRTETEMNEILQALARGYCSQPNKHKILDVDLIKSMTDETFRWYLAKENEWEVNDEAKDSSISDLEKQIKFLKANLEEAKKLAGTMSNLRDKGEKIKGLEGEVKYLKSVLREVVLMWQSSHDYTYAQSVWDMVHEGLTDRRNDG